MKLGKSLRDPQGVREWVRPLLTAMLTTLLLIGMLTGFWTVEKGAQEVGLQETRQAVALHTDDGGLRLELFGAQASLPAGWLEQAKGFLERQSWLVPPWIRLLWQAGAGIWAQIEKF